MPEPGELRFFGGGPRVYIAHWCGDPPTLRRLWAQIVAPELVGQVTTLAEGTILSVPDLMYGLVVVVREVSGGPQPHRIDDETLDAILREAEVTGDG